MLGLTGCRHCCHAAVTAGRGPSNTLLPAVLASCPPAAFFSNIKSEHLALLAAAKPPWRAAEGPSGAPLPVRHASFPAVAFHSKVSKSERSPLLAADAAAQPLWQPAEGACAGACGRERPVGSMRRKPGRGDPTLSMSCSDKLARWACLGVQVGPAQRQTASWLHAPSRLQAPLPAIDAAGCRCLHCGPAWACWWALLSTSQLLGCMAPYKWGTQTALQATGHCRAALLALWACLGMQVGCACCSAAEPTGSP